MKTAQNRPNAKTWTLLEDNITPWFARVATSIHLDERNMDALDSVKILMSHAHPEVYQSSATWWEWQRPQSVRLLWQNLVTSTRVAWARTFSWGRGRKRTSGVSQKFPERRLRIETWYQHQLVDSILHYWSAYQWNDSFIIIYTPHAGCMCIFFHTLPLIFLTIIMQLVCHFCCIFITHIINIEIHDIIIMLLLQ